MIGFSPLSRKATYPSTCRLALISSPPHLHLHRTIAFAMSRFRKYSSKEVFFSLTPVASASPPLASRFHQSGLRGFSGHFSYCFVSSPLDLFLTFNFIISSPLMTVRRSYTNHSRPCYDLRVIYLSTLPPSSLLTALSSQPFAPAFAHVIYPLPSYCLILFFSFLSCALAKRSQ